MEELKLFNHTLFIWFFVILISMFVLAYIAHKVRKYRERNKKVSIRSGNFLSYGDMRVQTEYSRHIENFPSARQSPNLGGNKIESRLRLVRIKK